MNTENIYDAVSGVDQQFVSAADDTDAIRLSFKKNRARKTKIIGSVVCCAALVLAAGWISSQNWLSKTPSVMPNETTNAGSHLTAPTQTEPTETQPGSVPPATDSTQGSEDRQPTTIGEQPSTSDKETEVPASSADNETRPSQADDTDVSQTEAVPQGNPNGSDEPSGGGNMYLMKQSTLEWNGSVYRDTDMPRLKAYTQDRYLGKAKDLHCNSNGEYNYWVSPDDDVYTVKETNDLLFVVKENGWIVRMVNSNWSLEKYEPERLEPGWVDPDYTPGDPVDVYN